MYECLGLGTNTSLIPEIHISDNGMVRNLKSGCSMIITEYYNINDEDLVARDKPCEMGVGGGGVRVWLAHKRQFSTT